MSFRLGVYIDGFNLYHGLKAAAGRKFLWLDVEALARTLSRPDQTLEFVKYFTADVRDAPASEARQDIYLRALETRSKTLIYRGRFQEKNVTCRQCKKSWRTYEEKETDVAIAAALMEDAVTEQWDTALIISGDSDLCPAVRALQRLRPAKRLVAAFPPKRHSDELRRTVYAAFTIGIGEGAPSATPGPGGDDEWDSATASLVLDVGSTEACTDEIGLPSATSCPRINRPTSACHDRPSHGSPAGPHAVASSCVTRCG